ncbi:hypothetical protein Slin15195_G055190 [Septoria linicola]|uniref:F-box domain-containing protein n=1 Tax=Septoria linicola TaxID=215465 RepID=A0A9Q9EIM9_9PEZI|nr:hypothetical protein Slin14017_G071050 [Septoria linicola]USW52200.1 hypothetical protein Slin15195_G055190 [Septoria linicola]
MTTTNNSLDNEPTPPSKCHLLSLPAELRNQIFEEALCPTGTLHLTTTKSKRYATNPIISPPLLATNHQIHNETKPLLLSNEICLTLDAHDTCWPVIAETILSQPILEKLEHVFLILDCTANFRADYEDVDFTALEALISLKTLRLAVVYDEMSGLADFYPEFNAMSEILCRVPAETLIVSMVEEGSWQADHLAEAMHKRQMPVSQFGNGNGNLRNVVQQRSIKRIEQETLDAAVRTASTDVRGSKSGKNGDVFASYRVEQGRRFGTRFSGGDPDFAI